MSPQLLSSDSSLHHKSRTLCRPIRRFSDHLLRNDPASSPGSATINAVIHLPAPSLGATSCPSRLYILLCSTMTGDYSPSPFVPSPARALARLITRFSYVIHDLARAKTAPPMSARAHAFALLLVYSNSQFRQRLLESRLKVTQALYGSGLHLWPF